MRLSLLAGTRSLQLEPAALQVLCTGFGERDSQPLAPLSPHLGPRAP